MIGYLSGTVLEIREKHFICMTPSGVGYLVSPAGSLLADIVVEKPCSFHVCTIVREQEISLYGFGSSEEKQLFERLIAVSGIGPKTALGMVSIPVFQFLSAVEKGDVSFLTRIPGLGKKTAERLIIELRGKLNFSAPSAAGTNPALDEAVEALENLGYDTAHIHSVLDTADEKNSAESLVTFFLSSRS